MSEDEDDQKKAAKPTGHVSPRRWMKYIARNLPLVKRIKKPERYLNSAQRKEQSR
jgi:hypothetical protein